MISITIGLVIVVAAMSAYLGASTAGKTSEAQSRMNEDAQAALNILAQQIRLAGTNPVQANREDAFRHNPVYDLTYVGGSVTSYGNGTTSYTVSSPVSAFSIRGCDGTFSDIITASNLDTLTTCNTPTVAAPSDSIAISYEADKYNTVPTTAGVPTDCVGSAIPTIINATLGTSTTATFRVADNRFYITSTANITSLHCKGIGSGTQPLVENIEDMQFTYGTVSTTDASPTATVAGYLNASEVAALGTSPATDATRWGKVLTVRICVVVRSENPTVPNAASGRYVKCDGTTDTTKTDLRLRRSYSTTVVLRNRRF